MAERVWNMLKLVPSVAASRKNSLITGLARIDESSDELILSLYHLPDPAEFMDVKDATYYAWFYDGNKKSWRKIGELQRKNGLTFNFRRKVNPEGDGIFITVEEKGREPKTPGNVILASNTEIFYNEMQEVSSETMRQIPVLEKSLEERDPLQARIEKILPKVEAAPKVEPEVVRIEKPEPKVEPEVVSSAKPEPKVEPEYIKIEEPLVKVEHVEVKAAPPNEPAPQKAKKKQNEEELLAHRSYEPAPAKQDNELFDRIKQFMSNFTSDLPYDEIAGMVKDRFDALRNEVNLQDIWEKIKEYVCALYEESGLKEFFAAIMRDIKWFLDRIGLDELWERIEQLIREIIEFFDVPEWIMHIKHWINQIDVKEWYETAKRYIAAILAEIDPLVLWARIRRWFEELLEKMNIDQIICWLRNKIHELMQMTIDEIKAELSRLFKLFLDALKLPELKMAILKAVVKDKINLVTGYFKHLKEQVLGDKPDGQPEPHKHDQQMSPYPQYPYQQGPNPQRNCTNPELYAAWNPYYRPVQMPARPLSNPGYYQPERGAASPANVVNIYASPTPYEHYAYSPYGTTPAYEPARMYDNPYIFKPAVDYSRSQGAHCPYSNWSCQYWQTYLRAGSDAVGDPRYLYDAGDENYYFITPDGEVIRRS